MNLESEQSSWEKTYVPHTLSIMKFTAARIEEIKSMNAALKLSSGNKLAFQTLPKHMRRRIASHNPKRVPKNMRSKHINQMKKSGLPSIKKRPSRKHRRRPRNLQDEYMRRQRKIHWLETHIWHAKRFHMVNKWGYRLPEKPCDKTFRACYRAMARHCLLLDISYFSCVSITGPMDLLTNNLKKLCDASIGLTFAAKAFINGSREGQTTLFTNTVPKKPIGNVYFIWKLSEDINRTIWIWLHPAFYQEALNTFIDCFSLEKSENDTNIYSNSVTEVTLEDLKFDFSRFRLVGPLSTAILQEALKLAHLTVNSEMDWEENFLENPDFEKDIVKTYSSSNQKVKEEIKKTVIENSNWFKEILNDSKSKQVLDEQKHFWKSLENITSPDQVSPHLILSLIVSDPRYSYPKKREKALPTSENKQSNYEIPKNVNKSWLWNKNVRKYVLNSKVSTKIINDLRSDLLVPGADLHHSGAPIPVMLVQQPGCTQENYGFGSGWDLIVPAGWGQSFWIALIMRGARSGGLREFNTLLFESGKEQFLPPDTKAGNDEEITLSEHCRRKYFSRPPNKRPNYRKFSIASPFSFNWTKLVQNWSQKDDIQNFFVIRSKKHLLLLQECLSKKRMSDDVEVELDCLVPVQIKMFRKGSPKTFAIICLPSSTDDFKNDPKEPPGIDNENINRKMLRKSWKKMSKKKRILKKKLKEKDSTDPKSNQPKPSDESLEYKNKLEKLWLPSSTNDVKNYCSKQLIGFITNGNFSFTNSRNCAIGYITLRSFPDVINSAGKVLVRNTNSLQYRFAMLKVIV